MHTCKWTTDNWTDLVVEKDGNAYCIHMGGFINLQVSPAVFYDEDSYIGKIITEWYGLEGGANPIVHIPFGEIINIINDLNKQSNSYEKI